MSGLFMLHGESAGVVVHRIGWTRVGLGCISAHWSPHSPGRLPLAMVNEQSKHGREEATLGDFTLGYRLDSACAIPVERMYRLPANTWLSLFCTVVAQSH